MVTDVALKDIAAVTDGDESYYIDLPHPLSINIRPILESVAGKLTDEEIDQWFVGFARANEGRGFYLELTAEGELVINPMVNLHSGIAEAEGIADVMIWSRERGGLTLSSRTIIRLPDGARAEPDMSWLSPEQVTELGPISLPRTVDRLPGFCRRDNVRNRPAAAAAAQDGAVHMANGALLGWLIDPYRRRVHVYRPDTDTEILEDPASVSADPVMPGFVFEVRQRIFALHETAAE